MHIWRLIERLLEKGIAVVILADTLPLADRLARTQNGKMPASYHRREFSSLPGDIPWQHLWSKEEALWL